MRRLTLYADGASRPNPGPAAIGIVVKDETGRVVKRIAGRLQREATSNEAEYMAVITALERAAELGAEHVDLRTDSELVVKQLKGRYRVRKKHIKPLWERATQLLQTFPSYSLEHIPRAENKAHSLTERALKSQKKTLSALD